MSAEMCCPLISAVADEDRVYGLSDYEGATARRPLINPKLALNAQSPQNSR